MRISTTAIAKKQSFLIQGSVWVLLLLVCSLGLAACGTSTPADGKVHLTLWYWNRSIDDKIIAQVNTHFPNIVLQANKITDNDNKLRTAMAGHYGVPDIVGINANVATYFPDEDQFYDLKTLGANDVASQYLPWKWNLGIAPDGKMIAFPMDTGPTALFYRSDIYAKAGLPTDPQQVASVLNTWDSYLDAAQKVKNATQGKSYLVDSLNDLYLQMMAQSPVQYFDKTTGKYIADQSYMKQIWDKTVQARQMDVSAKVPSWTQGWYAGFANGLVASFVGAVWMKQILIDAAPATKGNWRITSAPGGAGNNGGSFLGIPKASPHPKEAFEVIKWLQSPENQLIGYNDLQLYPSALSAISDPSMHQPEAFFGNQDTTQVFADAAIKVPTQYVDAADGTAATGFNDQLTIVEFQNKNPEQAWNDAQQATQKYLLR